MEMTTFHRRRQWRDKREQPSIEDLYMSHQAMGLLCALAGLGTFVILMLLIFGDRFVNLFFGG